MSKKLIYQDPELPEKSEIEEAIKGGNADEICTMLSGLSLYGEDFLLIENTILRLIYSENIQIVLMCITALDHLLRRFYDDFDQRKWLTIIDKINNQNNPKLIARIKMFISDMQEFSRETISIELFNVYVKEKDITIKIILIIHYYLEDKYLNGKSNPDNTKIDFCLYYINHSGEKSGKERFQAAYENVKELINDVKEKLGIILLIPQKSYYIME